jgi:hypothetical protein
VDTTPATQAATAVESAPIAAEWQAAITATPAAIAAATRAGSMAALLRAEDSAAEHPADFMVAGVVAPTAVVDTGNSQLPNTTRPALRSGPSCFLSPGFSPGLRFG